MNPRRGREGRAAILALLLLGFGTLIAGIAPLSLTYDEPIYIGAGYSDWVTRDMAWHGPIGHPPLMNLLTAWPLLLAESRPDPRAFPQWHTSDILGFARALLPQLGPLARTTFVTRLPVAWLTLLLGAWVCRWARELWRDRRAGLLALALFTLDPTILAHGRLNSTDMGLAAFGFLTAYALVRYLRAPTWRRAIGVGLAAGLPLSTKASGPYFVGIAGLLLLAWAGLTWRKRPRWFLKLTLTGLSWLLLALLVLWAAYLFEMAPLQPGQWPAPAASHWRGLAYIKEYMQSGQTTYFRGELYTQDHPWEYFLTGFVIKTPVPLLLISGGALWMAARRHPRQRGSDGLVLLSVPVGYFIVATLSALQIGQRHLLPLYPFLFVLCGNLARKGVWAELAHAAPKLRRIALGMAILLIGWLAWGTWSIQPYQLSYFNELCGGPAGGQHILADSSVDWGQTFQAARQYLETTPGETPYLAAFASIDPALYEFDFIPLPPTLNAPITLTTPFNPAPGIYLIGATPLHGLWLLDPDTYAWFRHRAPDATLGYALHVYHVAPPSVQPTWVAQCSDAPPAARLTPAQLTQEFGDLPLRPLQFDCARSWHYPAAGAGWYILPGDAPPSAWAQQALQTARLTYTQRDHWAHPALRIYQREAHSLPAPQTPQDVTLSGPLTFRGYTVTEAARKEGHTLEWATYWQVQEIPDRPLSLMGHLIGPDGTVAAVNDGLGVPLEYWRVGDVIVQRHTFSLPAAAAPGTYALHTGGYWLDTLERWTTAQGQSSLPLAGVRLEK